MPGPLRGIRVLDLTNMAAGPLASQILAEQGADVIKVEPPGRGDPIRVLGSLGPGGMSAIFAAFNRGKRSLALDLGAERGRELLRELACGADVFMQNLRPETADRKGIGEPELRALNPGLIYVSISGYGETGPLAGRRAYDTLLQAISGAAALQGEAEPDGRPRFVNTVICDKVTGLYAAQAIGAALVARARDGGSHLRVSMLDAALGFLWPDSMQQYTFPSSGESLPPRAPMPRVRATADGFITVSVHWDEELAALARALDAPGLASDPRFADAQARARNAREFDAEIDALLARRPSAECLERLRAEDVGCAPVNRVPEVFDDPQVRASGTIAELEHPTQGRMRAPRPVARFERASDPPGPRDEIRPAP
ncbi:MAG: CoA transferase [Proteobacteria bacterium]|nr:CoA transferase [Pseudomonadota bacterium]